MPRLVTRALVLVVLALLVAACGDDSSSSDDTTPEEAFCASGEQFESDVAALTDMDIVADGTDAVSSAFDTLRDDTDALVATGQDIVSDDINDIEAAVDQLGAALDELSGDLTAANASEVLDAVTNISTAAQSLQTTLTENCS
jgi:hypothetical protein